MESFFFWLFALMAVASAIFVVAARNPLHSALGLIVTFFALAGEYVLLSAHLLAALQVLVYAGAVMVLFVFVIMLLNVTDEDLGHPKTTPIKLLAALALAGGGTILASRLSEAVGGGAPGTVKVVTDLAGTPEFGTVAGVGKVIYGAYVLPFEVTSVLLLVAIVAAVVVAKARI